VCLQGVLRRTFRTNRKQGTARYRKKNNEELLHALHPMLSAWSTEEEKGGTHSRLHNERLGKLIYVLP
jgi:hypothetical protein